MKIEEIKIVNYNLILPKQLSKRLNWKFPFYSIPQLKDYSQKIIEFSKKHNKLPFYAKLDINNDGEEEIVLIQTSFFDKFGRLLIISNLNGQLKFDTIRWKRSVNALFFDYLIDISNPRSYQTFGFIDLDERRDLPKSKKINVKYPHIITKGYNERIVYWDGEQFCQERISSISDNER